MMSLIIDTHHSISIIIIIAMMLKIESNDDNNEHEITNQSIEDHHNDTKMMIECQDRMSVSRTIESCSHRL